MNKPRKHPYAMPYNIGHVAYKEGRSQGSIGKPKDTCQYSHSTINRAAWLCGWSETYQEETTDEQPAT